MASTQQFVSSLTILADAVECGLLAVDEAGTIVLVNKRLRQFLGFSRDDLVGQPVEMLIPEPLRGKHLHLRDGYLSAPVAREMAQDSDVTVLHKDGREIRVEIALAPLANTGSRYVVATVVDRSRPRGAEAVLLETNERLELAIDAAEQGLWDWNQAALSPVWWSPRVYQLLGYEPGAIEASFATFSALLHPADRLAVREAITRHLADGTPFDQEFRLRHRTQGYRWFRARGKACRDAMGDAARMVGTLGDIHARKIFENSVVKRDHQLKRLIDDVKRHQAALVQLTTDRDALTYSVAHDLRTPLRAINGFARILQEQYGTTLDREANRMLTIVADNGIRMGELIDGLLDFTRVSRDDIDLAPLAMEPLVQEVLASPEIAAGRSHVTVDLAGAPTVTGDADMLRRVWFAYLHNAIKFSKTSASPTIAVGWRAGPGEHTTFFVRDNGVGFDQRYAHKLFRMFERLHERDEFHGLGAKLAIVERIITRHGGRVWGEGTLGDGATFSFSLPHAEQAKVES